MAILYSCRSLIEYLIFFATVTHVGKNLTLFFGLFRRQIADNLQQSNTTVKYCTAVLYCTILYCTVLTRPLLQCVRSGREQKPFTQKV